MSHLGDFDAAAVIYGKFSTYRPSTGATFALGGSPALSVYKDNSTTQSTTGVTLTADFDAVTGLNHFAIDTSADGAFYADGSFFDIVITTGTVDSVSVTGSVVGSFTLRKTASIKPTTAGRTLDVSAGGEAGLDWANIGSPTTAQNLSATNIDVDQVVASVSGAVGSVTGAVGSVTGAVGSVTAAVTVGTINAGVITATSIAADAITDAKVAADVTIASVTGAVGSVTGAVGSVTGAVGSVGAGGITAASFAADAITAAKIAADVTTELQAGLATSAALATAQTDLDDIQTRLPAALVSGRMDASVGAMAAGVITATSIAADAITDAKVAADVTIASVTGAVGSVTGNVGGNVTGSVGSIATGGIVAGSFAAGAIDAAAIAANAIGASELAADAATEIAAAVRVDLTTELGRIDVAVSSRLATAGYTAPDNASITSIFGVTTKLNYTMELGVGSPTYYRFTAPALELAPTGGSAPTAAANAIAVWDAVRASHTTAGTFGQGAASVQGNVTGSVASVTGAVGSVASGGIVAASFAAGAIDAAAIAPDAIGSSELAASAATEIAAAVRVDLATELARIDVATGTRASQVSLDAVDDFVDTEIAAIKVVTDKLDAMTEPGVGSPSYNRFTAPALELAPTGGSAPSAATISAAVWDKTRSAHVIVGSFGEGAASVQGNVTGSVGSVAGAVGSVTGNVGGNVVGSVGSVTGGVTVTTVNDKTGYRLSATGVDDMWDEAIAGHLTAGTTGKSLNDATSAGNPWNSVLEGVLTAGDLLRIQAGVAVGKTDIIDNGNGTAHVEFRDASDLSLIVAADMTGSERTAVALTP